MPLTLQFGPWAPDLANDPVQIPDTLGPLPIPCADVLNVYFSNGSYKSIPAPAPAVVNGATAQLLNAPALNAYSYFDYVEQRQTVFVGTAGNIQQLNADGSWSVANFLTNTGTTLVGQPLSINAGFFTNTRGLRAASMAFAQGRFTAGVFGTSFVAGSVTFTNPANGFITTKKGFEGAGISTHPIGTCAHPGLLSGTLVALEDVVANAATVTNLIILSTSDPTQAGFSTIKANGKTFSSSAATYTYSAFTTQAFWQWTTPFGFAGGSTYPVVLT